MIKLLYMLKCFIFLLLLIKLIECQNTPTTSPTTPTSTPNTTPTSTPTTTPTPKPSAYYKITGITVIFGSYNVPTMVISGNSFPTSSLNNTIINFVNANFIGSLDYNNFTVQNDSTIYYSISDYQVQNTVLVETDVYICGGERANCINSKPVPEDIFHFSPYPFCNQTSWNIDAGVQSITVTGAAFPTNSSVPPQIAFIKNGLTKGTSPSISSPNMVTFTIDKSIHSGINIGIVFFNLNYLPVLISFNKFSFNPPNITSIECQSTSCIVKGTSFAKTSESLVINVNSNLGQEKVTNITGNGQGSIIIPNPSKLLLIAGQKNISMNYDSNVSQNYLFTVIPKILSVNTSQTGGLITIIGQNLYLPDNSTINSSIYMSAANVIVGNERCSNLTELSNNGTMLTCVMTSRYGVFQLHLSINNFNSNTSFSIDAPITTSTTATGTSTTSHTHPTTTSTTSTSTTDGAGPVTSGTISTTHPNTITEPPNHETLILLAFVIPGGIFAIGTFFNGALLFSNYEPAKRARANCWSSFWGILDKDPSPPVELKPVKRVAFLV